MSNDGLTPAQQKLVCYAMEHRMDEIARRMVQRVAPEHDDSLYDDLRQIGALAVIKAAQKSDEGIQPDAFWNKARSAVMLAMLDFARNEVKAAHDAEEGERWSQHVRGEADELAVTGTATADFRVASLELADSAPNPEQSAALTQAGEILNRVAARIEQRRRKTLERSALDEISNAEIAGELDRSHTCVSQILGKAGRDMRDRLRGAARSDAVRRNRNPDDSLSLDSLSL